jgi:hypothetical protein
MNFDNELLNIYKNYSYEQVNYDIVFGTNYGTYFDVNMDKNMFNHTLDRFIKQNNWSEIDRINYYSYIHENNIIKIYPNNFKTNHKTKYHYTCNICDNANDEICNDNIDNYVSQQHKFNQFKMLIYNNVPVQLYNVDEKDNNVGKRSLLELENNKLFVNYFIPCIDNVERYQTINKIFMKFTDNFTLHFDEIQLFEKHNLEKTFYKIYLKIEINSDIANSLDETVNSQVHLPTYSQINEKMTNIYNYYNNIDNKLDSSKYYMHNITTYNLFPKHNIRIKLKNDYFPTDK